MNDQQLAAKRALFSDKELVHLSRNENGMYPWGIGTTREDYLRAVRTVLGAALTQREQGIANPVKAAYEAWRKGTRFSNDPSYAFECIDKATYAYFERKVYGGANLTKREPVAEGEVQRYSPAIYRSTTTDSKPIMKPNKFGDYVYLPDWQRTEAARLMAVSDLELARMQNDGMMSELYRELELEPDEVRFKWVMIAISDLKRQLTAERSRSAKLVGAVKEISSMSADDDLIEVAIEVATDAIAAYQSSKENVNENQG